MTACRGKPVMFACMVSDRWSATSEDRHFAAGPRGWSLSVLHRPPGQTAVRVLFILDGLGEPCVGWPQVPDMAVWVIQSQRKLQKLGFLVRNPDYLANLIISRWWDGSLPAERLLDARPCSGSASQSCTPTGCSATITGPTKRSTMP